MYKNYTNKIGIPKGYVRKLMLIMRLTTVLLIATIMQVSASVSAQKVTFSENNTSLKRLFKAIKAQTGYNVVLSSEQLNAAKPISVNFQDAPLEEVLKKSLFGQNLTYNIEKKNIVISKEAPSFIDRLISHLLAIDIKGRILNEKGEPMAGATVKVKGMNKLVTTDKDGNFILKDVDENAVIVFSFTGYATKEMPASKANNTGIKMEPSSQNLKEVTVTTAYGIERSKKELGYSVAKVSGADINKANSGSILTGLTGKVSGLNIMTQSSEMSPKMRVLLRGIRSFGESSNNQPLFVFNGAPLSFGSDIDAAQRSAEFINNLNPSDIEDVTVLKGANGTAMYGPEGVNGVIIITTKKVKSGEMSVNARVNMSYNRMDFRQRSDQRTFGVGDAVSLLGGNATSNWGAAYDGRMISIGYPDINGKFQQVPYSDLNDRYDFFNVARTTRTNVSLSSADPNSSIYMGLGRVDQTGLLPGDKQSQTTILFNSSKKVGKSADLQFNINYSKSESDRGTDVTSSVLNLPSFIPLLSYKDYKNSYWGSLDNYWSGVNPYAALDLVREKTTDNSFTGSLTANVKLFPWLSVKNQLSMNYTGRNSKKNTAAVVFSDYARVDSKKRTDKEPRTEDVMNNVYGVNNDFLVSSLHKTGDFLIRGNLGSTIRENFSKQIKTGAILVIPIYNNIFARSDIGKGADELSQQTRSISAFGNVSIGYKDKIFFELTGRNEWDSKRAKVARGKDFYFGANTSLVMKEMIPFLKEQNWLSNFRLRLSATRTANMNIEPQQSERTFLLVYPYPYTNSATGKSILGYGIFTNPNPNIKPEKIFSQEYGTELGFLNNRITLDAAYYHQVNDGIIMKVGVPAWSGYPDLDNAGRFRNTGWEFDANLNPLVDFGNDINISLTGRFSINNNKVLEVSDIYQGTFIAREPGGSLYYAREGHSAFEFPVLDFIRDPQGRVVVDKLSGMPTVDYSNPKIMGKTLPVYQGGVTFNFTFKRLTLSTQADYSAGNDHAFSPSLIANGTSGLTLINNREIFVFPNSVIEDSPGHFVENTNIAVSNAGKDLFSRFASANIHTISSGNFWKIREVALQYELPVNRRWLKKATASVYARDLFSFYPHSNIYGDPVASNGPGLRTPPVTASGLREARQTNNVSGGSSDTNTAPGTVLYGFTIGLSF